MDELSIYCGVFVALFIQGVRGYEACRVIQDVTVTFCEDGFYCCNNNTQCCNKGWNPVAIAALVIGCIIGIGFIVACIVLCVKRNNNSKVARQRLDIDLGMVYMSDGSGDFFVEADYSLDFPPPYLAHFRTDGLATETTNFPEPPPPYETETTNIELRNSIVNDFSDREFERIKTINAEFDNLEDSTERLRNQNEADGKVEEVIMGNIQVSDHVNVGREFIEQDVASDSGEADKVRDSNEDITKGIIKEKEITSNNVHDGATVTIE